LQEAVEDQPGQITAEPGVLVVVEAVAPELDQEVPAAVLH